MHPGRRADGVRRMTGAAGAVSGLNTMPKVSPGVSTPAWLYATWPAEECARWEACGFGQRIAAGGASRRPRGDGAEPKGPMYALRSLGTH